MEYFVKSEGYFWKGMSIGVSLAMFWPLLKEEYQG
jgi:hypothetical protein